MTHFWQRNYYWVYCGSWSCNTLASCCKEPTHWKRPWCWKRLRAEGEAGDKGWGGCMSSSTQWTWVWANSGRSWRTGKPGMLQTMELRRVRHDLVTEQQQQQQLQQKQHTFQNDHHYKSSYHYDCMVTIMIQKFCILVDYIPPHCAFRTCDLFIL